MDEASSADAPALRSAVSKAMWRILPLIFVCYLIAYVDRVNTSFASLQMNVDLKFSATVYGLGGTMFFLGYGLFEIPSSLFATRFGPRGWMARIMIVWGLLAAATLFVRTPMQFYALRFLLGVAEAGFFPSLIFYFAGWFPMTWRGRAVSRVYVAAPLGTVVMGAVSVALLGLNGLAGLRGWQWLFLVQGLPAVAMGIAVFALLPDNPAKAAWLTGAEKAALDAALARDAAAIGEPARHDLLAAFRQPMVRLLGAAGFLMNISTVGLLLSAPAVLIARADVTAGQAGAVVSLGGLLGAGAILLGGWLSDRRGDRLRYALIAAAAIAVGLLLIGLSPSPALVLLGYLAFAAGSVAHGALVASAWADVLHPRLLAVGAAAINTLWQVGSFTSPYLWGVAKDATGGFEAGLVGGAVAAVGLGGLLVYVRGRVLAERRTLSSPA